MEIVARQDFAMTEEPSGLRTQAPSQKRKRPRAIQACERCRLKKYKCDESRPDCSHCKRAGVACKFGRFIRAYEDGNSESKIRDLEEEVEELHARLRGYESMPANANLGWVAPESSSQRPVAPASEAQTRTRVAVSPRTIPPTSKNGALPRPPSVRGDAEQDEEITDVNTHTNQIEFHGNTSSLAFLGDLETLPGCRTPRRSPLKASLVSELHNPAFPHNIIRASGSTTTTGSSRQTFYFPQAHVFIEAYFSGLHFIHPIIEKESFMSRAHDLWCCPSPAPSVSFVAKYFAVLSLGALTRPWPEDRLDGYTRFEWSRRLFKEALKSLDEVQFGNDLDTIHCLYLMAKVCQNELAPHLAWMYLGRAVRACISAGFNRDTPNVKAPPSQELSWTWWGIYSLEIETSFSLGRADTLGLDEFHNRPLPPRDKSEHSIIPYMVDFGRIVRKVSLFYTEKSVFRAEHMEVANQLELELEAWLAKLPSWISPISLQEQSQDALREPEWCHRHRLVLEIRFHNVKMALFRGFIDLYAHGRAAGSEIKLSLMLQYSDKCVASAQRTIEVMYDTFKRHTYFRSWWYNTTYIMMAAAAVLSYIQRVTTDCAPSLKKLVEMAMEILSAMDESAVARKCSQILSTHLERINNVGLASYPASAMPLADDAAPEGGTLFPPPGGDTQEDINYFGQQILDYSFQDMAALFDELNDTVIFN